MVGHAGGDFHRIVRIRRLRHMGGVSKRALHVWSVPLALLFTRTLWCVAACLVWTQTWMVAGVRAVFTGAADPAVPGVVPVHLLLLPRRLLQIILGRPAGVRGRRAAQELPR